MVQCLPHLVSNAAKNWPRHIAVGQIDKQAKWVTYEKLEQEVKRLAGQLLQKGLDKGQRVGLLSRNSLFFITHYFAISRAGGVVVPFNYTLDPRDIAQQANDCTISALFWGKGLEGKAESVIRKVKSIKFARTDLKASGGKISPPGIKKQDLALIVYTSGTTRHPLGVMLSHKNLISNSKSIVKYAHLRSSDKICCVLPFYYIYGLSLLSSHFLAGGTVIIDNRFMYPNAVLDTIDKYNATGFAGVSSHYAILLHKSNFKKRALTAVRYFMQAGDKMPPNMTKEIINKFPNKKLYIMYGQTEASPRLTYLKPHLALKKPDSIGRAIPGVKIKVIGRQGKECAVGKPGEIIAKGDNVMLGYWNNNSLTKKVIKKGGWLYTGDIAVKDKDGDLYIVGRKKNFIKVGAHRVNPFEIENVIMEDARIMEVAAIGVSDAVLGEKIKLLVSLVPGKKLKSEEIIKLCKKRLPPYKIPSKVVFLKSIPKKGYGKIDKEELRMK